MCKISRKTDSCFQKWHEEFGKFLFTGWKIVISFSTLEINNTINQTFYTCSSTEWLLLRYKKKSKKAAKLGSFLQCSVHMFLRHNSCFWKINLKILWNHIKNFQAKHGQCDSIIFPSKTFYFEGSKALIARPLHYWK